MASRVEGLNKSTSKLFSDWQSYLNELSVDLGSDIVIQPSKHMQERGGSRNITTQQIKHILQNNFIVE